MTKVIVSGLAASFGAGARRFLAGNVADGTIEVVALVDVDPKALAFRPTRFACRERLLPTCTRLSQRTRPISARSSCRRATTNSWWTPPSSMASAFCAKNRSPTRWASYIVRKVKDAGRHGGDHEPTGQTTLRRIIRSGRLGRVNSVSCRYAADLRAHGTGRLFPAPCWIR